MACYGVKALGFAVGEVLCAGVVFRAGYKQEAACGHQLEFLSPGCVALAEAVVAYLYCCRISLLLRRRSRGHGLLRPSPGGG